MEYLGQHVNSSQQHAVGNRLIRQILKHKSHQNPFKMEGQDANNGAEAYYRQDLRRRHIKSAFTFFKDGVNHLDSWDSWRSGQYNQSMLTISDGKNGDEYLAAVERVVLYNTIHWRLVFLQQNRRRDG